MRQRMQKTGAKKRLALKADHSDSNVADLKSAARGRECELLESVAGIPAKLLDGKHHGCPKCGGVDRFRLIDPNAGSVFCNQCFSKKCGDFLSAIAWMRNCTLADAFRYAKEHLSIPPVVSATGKQDAKQTRTYKSSTEAIAACSIHFQRPPDSEWQYHSATRDHVGSVLRWNIDGRKEFRQVSRQGQSWTCKAMPELRPLYRLPEVQLAKEVWVFEGEKLADLAASIGLSATTSPGGASGAGHADWSPLAGKRIVVVPDNDEPGTHYAATLIDRLLELSPPVTVEIVKLPDIEQGEDFEQWLGLQIDRDSVEQLKILDSLRVVVDVTCRQNYQEIPENESCVDIRMVDSGQNDAESKRDYGEKPFPTEVLPAAVRELVQAGSRSLQCDPSYIGVPALSAMAGAIGNARTVTLKEGWIEPAIIWTSLVGASGDKKSPALSLAVDPLLDLQCQELAGHNKNLAHFEDEMEQYDAKLRIWRKRPEGDPPRKPMAPNCKRYIVSDSTVEALAHVLSQSPRGVLLYRDELDSWLGSFDRYAGGKGSDVPFWLSVYNAKSLVIDRRSAGTILVRQPCVSVTGGIQPVILRKAMKGVLLTCGLGPRFLFTLPKKRVTGWVDACIDDEVTQRYRMTVQGMLDIEANAISDETRPRFSLSLDRSALLAFKDYCNHLSRLRDDASDDMCSFLAKLESYAARLALVMQLAETPNAVSVAGEWMDAAIVLCQWFGGQAERILLLIHGNEETDRFESLSDWIRRSGGRITARDLQRGRRGYRTAEDADDDLAELAKAGYGTYTFHQPDTGRPTRVFTLSQ